MQAKNENCCRTKFTKRLHIRATSTLHYTMSIMKIKLENYCKQWKMLISYVRHYIMQREQVNTAASAGGGRGGRAVERVDTIKSRELIQVPCRVNMVD